MTSYTPAEEYFDTKTIIITSSSFIPAMLPYMFCNFPYSFCICTVHLVCGQGNVWFFNSTPLLSSCLPCLTIELFHMISPLKKVGKVTSRCDCLLANWEEHYWPLTAQFITTWGMSNWFWLLPEANEKLSHSWNILKIFWNENVNVIHSSCQWTSVSVNSLVTFRFSDF